MSNPVSFTDEQIAKAVFAPCEVGIRQTYVLLPGVTIAAIASVCSYPEVLFQAVIESVNDNDVICRSSGDKGINEQFGNHVNKYRQADIALFDGTVSIPKSAIIRILQPTDQEKLHAYLQAHHPKIQPQLLTALSKLVLEIYEGADIRTGDELLLDFMETTNTPQGRASISLEQISAQWLEEPTFTELYLANGLTQCFNQDTTGTDGYSHTTIVKNDDFVALFQFFCGYDEDEYPNVHIDVCFGPLEQREQALLAWQKGEVSEAINEVTLKAFNALRRLDSSSQEVALLRLREKLTELNEQTRASSSGKS